jgi:hypothetical protein
MQNAAYRDLFSKHIEALCETYFHPDTLEAQIEHWQNLIAPYVEADPYYPLDFGYDMQDFYNAPNESCCGHVPNGILPYAEARRASALAQLESYNETTDAHWITQQVDTNAVILKAHIEGPINSVQANYSWDGVAFNSGTMIPASENIFGYEGPAFNTSENKLYYRAILNGNYSFPCIPDFHWMTRSSLGVRINEACASNQSIIADNAGEYDDWVELYNTTNSSISLANCFLTDDRRNWNRWQLTDTLLPANGYLVFWLDDDLEQGRQHANFKLSYGEELMLYRIEEGKPRIVDRVDGFFAGGDVTWALQPDGGSDSAFTSGTPGGPNSSTIVSESDSIQALLHPNPANIDFYWPYQSSATLYDIQGRPVNEVHAGSNSCHHLSAGIYLVSSGQAKFKLIVAH